MYRILLVISLFWSLAAAAADEALIRRTIESKLGGAKVESVQPTPLAGVYEVTFRSSDGVQIIYTNADATHIMIGRLIDVKTDRDLTEERMRKFSTINMDTLPYDLAVKVQRGNGKRALVIFSDPHCPACKKFEKELATIDDITIHYFMYPVIRPELADQSRAVWCAPTTLPCDESSNPGGRLWNPSNGRNCHAAQANGGNRRVADNPPHHAALRRPGRDRLRCRSRV